ncbi:MAG TPA: hypothetical protein PKL69_07485 [Agitococcus sp.]|nr:hypothetical protein [Agitococcus sp.]HMX98186.1 hypothetical protein [Agitococcus sp.]HMY81172.1 hypothetical protein [Agitococcus sp.]HNA20629.1 hypothetical protein [Agitococcus sp.]HNC01779.1 hypothetical protein [Agitococcus sp.]
MSNIQYLLWATVIVFITTAINLSTNTGSYSSSSSSRSWSSGSSSGGWSYGGGGHK